ncbi:MAG: hypothetical protein PHQ81_02090 [Methanofollis sp.]|nr:hypothetical protein [Methanofollis sp.]
MTKKEKYFFAHKDVEGFSYRMILSTYFLNLFCSSYEKIELRTIELPSGSSIVLS